MFCPTLESYANSQELLPKEKKCKRGIWFLANIFLTIIISPIQYCKIHIMLQYVIIGFWGTARLTSADIFVSEFKLWDQTHIYDRIQVIQGTSYYYFSNRGLQKFRGFPWVTGTLQYVKISTRTHRLRILQKSWILITFGWKNAQYVLKNAQFSSILLYKIEFSSQFSTRLCSAFLQFLTNHKTIK